METAYIPNLVVTSNGEEEYSNLSEVLNGTFKEFYAIQSKDFSTVDGTLIFMPLDKKYK